MFTPLTVVGGSLGVSRRGGAAIIPHLGDLCWTGSGPVPLAEARFGERAAGPGERLVVPAVEGDERRPVARGVREPAAPEVDAGMRDLTRRGARSRPEEEDVARLEPRLVDAARSGDLAGHPGGSPVPDGRTEPRRPRPALELVDAPDEARAVEAAARGDAEERLRRLRHPAPHVRVAGEPHRALQHAALPVRQRRHVEPDGPLVRTLEIRRGEREETADRERRLGPRRRVVREELSVVTFRRVVEAKREETRDRLPPGTLGWGEPRGGALRSDLLRSRGEAERAHESAVELRERDRARRIGDDLLPARDPGDDLAELAARQRIVRAKRGNARAHETALDRDADVRLRPRRGRRGGARGESEPERGEAGGEPAHIRPIVGIFRRL